jgi:hypothetical protein
MWNVINAEEIKPHTLEIMNYVKPRPDYLIVGTGEKTIALEFSFVEHFRRMGITVDSCPSVSHHFSVFLQQFYEFLNQYKFLRMIYFISEIQN